MTTYVVFGLLLTISENDVEVAGEASARDIRGAVTYLLGRMNSGIRRMYVCTYICTHYTSLAVQW